MRIDHAHACLRCMPLHIHPLLDLIILCVPSILADCDCTNTGRAPPAPEPHQPAAHPPLPRPARGGQAPLHGQPGTSFSRPPSRQLERRSRPNPSHAPVSQPKQATLILITFPFFPSPPAHNKSKPSGRPPPVLGRHSCRICPTCGLARHALPRPGTGTGACYNNQSWLFGCWVDGPAPLSLSARHACPNPILLVERCRSPASPPPNQQNPLTMTTNNPHTQKKTGDRCGRGPLRPAKRRAAAAAGGRAGLPQPGARVRALKQSAYRPVPSSPPFDIARADTYRAEELCCFR